jgi:hypothetical protein
VIRDWANYCTTKKQLKNMYTTAKKGDIDQATHVVTDGKHKNPSAQLHSACVRVRIYLIHTFF